MSERRGLPIAAYLAVLVVLALAAAFVAVVSIVLWLPPRPPAVMRADVVADHFQAGYDYMAATGRPLNESGMVWSVSANPPRAQAPPEMRTMQARLAGSLDLNGDQVRVAASNIMRNDVFVFRVRDVEELHEDAERAVRDAERIRRDIERRGADEEEAANRAAEIQQRRLTIEGGEIIVAHPAGEEGGERRTFEFRIPVPPTPPVESSKPPVAPEPPVPPHPPMFAPAPAGVLLLSGFEIGAQLADGRWLVMRQGRNWAELSWIARATLIIGGTLLVLSVLALLFARRLTRPIRNFSDAVQAVGVDPQSEPVREEGPRELRGAARAVNTMQARLRALIADRTKTLAAVAHDMRTPLMRLRLTAENAPPEQREKMVKEIGEVEALVASFIAFARDDPAEEARVRLDLGALLQSIADDHAEHGRAVAFDGGDERVVVTGQSLGLKRLFSNLVENALKYGASARIALRRQEGFVIVEVEDDGPGVPADQRDSVFEPFVRLNEAGTRGAGLGLAAARSIARAHGGDIVILDAETGALVRVTLPG